MKASANKIGFAVLILVILGACKQLPYGYNANISTSFLSWNLQSHPDTLFVNEIFFIISTGKGPNNQNLLNVPDSKVKEQIRLSLEDLEKYNIVIRSDVKYIDIPQEDICPMSFKKDSCTYLRNLTEYVDSKSLHDRDRIYLIPSIFVKTTWRKVSESTAASGGLSYFGRQKHYRQIQIEVPVFKNGRLVYNDSNYFLDSLTVDESQLDQLLQIDQVIFDSLLYYSFDGKVEPLKLN